jgi:hypothetical protein
MFLSSVDTGFYDIQWNLFTVTLIRFLVKIYEHINSTIIYEPKIRESLSKFKEKGKLFYPQNQDF